MTYINLPFIRQVANQLHDMLGDDFDPETFMDTLDGETDAGDILDRLIADRLEAKALAAAIAEQEKAMKARRDRMEARAKAFDAAILDVLNAAKIKKAERPRATVSRRSGSQSVAITDEASVPSQLCKVVSSPDKTAIKAQLQAGEAVPGAELVRGADGITVRVA